MLDTLYNEIKHLNQKEKESLQKFGFIFLSLLIIFFNDFSNLIQQNKVALKILLTIGCYIIYDWDIIRKKHFINCRIARLKNKPEKFILNLARKLKIPAISNNLDFEGRVKTIAEFQYKKEEKRNRLTLSCLLFLILVIVGNDVFTRSSKTNFQKTDETEIVLLPHTDSIASFKDIDFIKSFFNEKVKKLWGCNVYKLSPDSILILNKIVWNTFAPRKQKAIIKGYPYLKLPEELHKTYFHTKNAIITKIVQKGVHEYEVSLDIDEYNVVHNFNEASYKSEPDKINAIIKRLNEFYFLKSNSAELSSNSEKQIEEQIRNYLIGECVLTKQQNKDYIFQLGLRFNLVLRKDDRASIAFDNTVPNNYTWLRKVTVNTDDVILDVMNTDAK